MTKYVLMGLLGVLALAVVPTTVQAQVFFSRPARPLGPGYGGGLFGGGPFGGPLGGPFGPTAGYPGLNYGPNAGYVPATTGLSGGQGGQGSQAGLPDVGTPAVTGHPTRFAAYGGYFNSQGGGSSSTATAPSRVPATATNAATNQQTGSLISRTRPNQTGSSRTQRR